MKFKNRPDLNEGKERNVLIIDDDKDFTISLANILKSYGYVVEVAYCAEGCWKKIRGFDAQVVLIDIRLQHTSGISLIANMKKARPGIICVMLTAYAATDTAIEALQKGAYDYLRKPFDARDLLSTLDRCFEKIRLEKARNAAEADLMASEERFRAITENSADITVVLNEQGAFKYISSSVKRIYGYSEQEVLGKAFADFIHHDDLPIVDEALQNAIQNPGKIITAPDFLVRTKSGERIYLEGLFSDLIDVPGINGIVVNCRDITERKRTEEKLEHSYQIQDVINKILEISLDPIPLVKQFDRVFDLILSVPWLSLESKGAIFLVDGKSGELILTSAHMLDKEIHTKCAQVPFGKCFCGKAALTKKMQFSDVVDDRHENQYKGISQHGHYCVPILSSGMVLGVLTLYLKEGHRRNKEEENFLLAVANGLAGIIEHKKAEKEKQKLQSQLNQAQKMESLGRLAGGIAHDFNNILTAINGYTELTLAKMNNNNPSRKNIEAVLDAGKKAKDLTKQLLAFSRKQITKPEILNLNSTTENMQKMLKRLIGENIKINIIASKQLWNIKIEHSQIEQLIMNLAVNAKDAMPNGGNITIKTENILINKEDTKMSPFAKPGKYVLMTVSDTGCGMSGEIKEFIFEPFFTTKENGNNTGLGLSTVYGIINQNNGFILVYSEPGKGTTFKIYLPSTEKEIELMEIEQPGKMPHGTETILVVEDVKEVRKLVTTVLSCLGYTVIEAKDGQDALIKCNEYQRKIDLLLTDMIMPGMSASELSNKLRKCCPTVKVIHMSGYTENDIIDRGLLGCGEEFLQKPISTLALAQTVRKVMDNDKKIMT